MLWVYVVRALVVVVCLWSIVSMSVDFRDHKDNWNERTRDFWYGRMMWCATGVAGGIEGIIRHVPFRYSLVLLIVASLVTLKGNLQKGQWGNDE